MLSLTRWNPFEELTSLHRELDRVFGRSWGEFPAGKGWSWVPATEVTSDEHGWTVRMALPGIEPKDVHVDLTHNVLTVSGERATEVKSEEKAERHMSEIGYGHFERSFTLPENVAAEDVAAHFDNGMLELRLPLREAAKPRRIEIGGKSQATKVA
jgi:HSP20 family protein